jgi:hypothetical protein
MKKNNNTIDHSSNIIINILGVIIGPVYLGALAIGWFTTNPIIFHSIYFICVFTIGIGLIIFSVLGRSKSEENYKLANFIGSTGYFIVGVTFIVLYIAAVLTKL